MKAGLRSSDFAVGCQRSKDLPLWNANNSLMRFVPYKYLIARTRIMPDKRPVQTLDRLIRVQGHQGNETDKAPLLTFQPHCIYAQYIERGTLN